MEFNMILQKYTPTGRGLKVKFAHYIHIIKAITYKKNLELDLQ